MEEPKESEEPSSSSTNELGEFMRAATTVLRADGWNACCDRMRGRGDIQDDVKDLPHKAAGRLDRVRRNGVPVLLSSAPWSAELKQKRFLRGPHRSAMEYAVFLAEEFEDFVRKGFWMLLPYEEVKDMAGLRLSPIGVVPQRDRRPRIIVDYSFYGINAETVKLSIAASMQFGRALDRIHQHVAFANPKFGDVSALKIDIGDGFYRIPVANSGVLKLGVLLPPIAGQPAMVAFPLVLPMGWTESPPFFCEFTETACDLINEDLRRNIRYPEHPLEGAAGAADGLDHPDHGQDTHEKRPTPRSYAKKLYTKPLARCDVFVDDFMLLNQESPSNPRRNQRRTALHNIDRVFRPSDALDSPVRKEPISTSKLKKGDAAYQSIKRILGWDEALTSRNVLLAPHRREKVVADITEVLSHRRCGLQKWQSLLGQLRSLVPGLPGSEGQFSVMQAAQHAGRVTISPKVHSQLNTFLDLLDPTQRPTHIEELVPGDPVFEGSVDAAKAGMGGVWFTDNDDDDDPPLVWRAPFPEEIQNQLSSFKNPTGAVTNSDLELAGTIVHQAVLGQEHNVAGETSHTHCDNTPAVFWRIKGSSTTTRCRADLLRIAAFVRRKQRGNQRISHISGPDNVMADDASRLMKMSDADFLTYFNSTYPQTHGWKLCPPPKGLLSAVLTTLSDGALSEPCLTTALQQLPVHGKSGKHSATPPASAPALETSMTRSHGSSSLESSCTTAPLHPKGSRLALAMRRTTYDTWARRFPQWVP